MVVFIKSIKTSLQTIYFLVSLTVFQGCLFGIFCLKTLANAKPVYFTVFTHRIVYCGNAAL